MNSQEASLLTAFRKLPPEAAGELSRLVQRLADRSPGPEIDWSDSWPDADLEELRAASVRRMEHVEYGEADGTPVLPAAKLLDDSARLRRVITRQDLELPA